MKLEIIEKNIAKIPLIIKGNKESLLCIKNKFNLYDGNSLLKELDDYKYQHKHQNIAIVSGYKDLTNRFPSVYIKEPFWEKKFNENLFEKYELAKNIFFKQSDIKSKIASNAKKNDFIVLIVVDGLSFMDCKDWEDVRPCLVDTLTNTECGFKNIIGNKQSIAYILFQNQYRKSIGFSYWDRSNELTKDIFSNCSPLHKVEKFSEILTQIPKINFTKTYLQIILNGLDGIAHRNRDEPIIDAIVENIYTYLKRLKDKLIKTNKQGILYLTADHGILWKHKDNLITIQPDTEINVHTRHYSKKLANPRGINVDSCGKYYNSLKYPFITRKMKTNEWGVHGGISLYESIVPFLEWKIN